MCIARPGAFDIIIIRPLQIKRCALIAARASKVAATNQTAEHSAASSLSFRGTDWTPPSTALNYVSARHAKQPMHAPVPMLLHRATPLLLLWVLLSSPCCHAGASPAWSPEAFPDPWKNMDKCGRGVRSAICDPDHVLSQEVCCVHGCMRDDDATLSACRASHLPDTYAQCSPRHQGANILEGEIAKIRAGDDPYIRAPCGGHQEGFQVRWMGGGGPQGKEGRCEGRTHT